MLRLVCAACLRCGVNGELGAVVNGGNDEKDRDGEKHNNGGEVDRTVYSNVLQFSEKFGFFPVLLHFDTPFGMMILRPRGWMRKISHSRVLLSLFFPFVGVLYKGSNFFAKRHAIFTRKSINEATFLVLVHFLSIYIC